MSKVQQLERENAILREQNADVKMKTKQLERKVLGLENELAEAADKAVLAMEERDKLHAEKTALINTNLTGKTLRHALATSEARHLVLGAECIDRYRTTADDEETPYSEDLGEAAAGYASAARDLVDDVGVVGNGGSSGPAEPVGESVGSIPCTKV